MKYRFERGVILSLFSVYIIFLWGCPRRDDLKKSEESSSAKGFNGISIGSVIKILKNIEAERGKVRSAEGYAKLRVYKKNGRRTTYRLFFQIKRPDKISLNFTLAMQPVVMAVSDGKRFFIYYLTQNRILFGDKGDFAGVFSEFIPQQVRLEELVPILLGEFPIPKGAPVKVERAGEIQIVHWKRGGGEISMGIVPQRKEFRWLRVHYKKRNPLKIEYGTFRGKPPFPKRVKFIDFKRGRRFHWIYSRYTVNKEIPDEAFRIDLAQLKRDNPKLRFYQISH